MDRRRRKTPPIARCLAHSDAAADAHPALGNRKQFFISQRERYVPALHTDNDVHNQSHKPKAEVERLRHNNGAWLFAQKLAAEGELK